MMGTSINIHHEYNLGMSAKPALSASPKPYKKAVYG